MNVALGEDGEDAWETGWSSGGCKELPFMKTAAMVSCRGYQIAVGWE